ncbi:alpha/beta hydrolase [[Mycobacterium] nativiensis]|uniref:Alpha/beta hydrolase n=1 Tax=[Mycobacterium] nativiensis TaxID=2855503 RepID=A0ABU5XWS7_9MYCO|nr:alpha/beta hydrolase [Mycolicibacter sp. MYC340]MEB3032432.1 alpha/beta hydrolase [Mycolicibacter sp. MYC340]
MPNSPFHTDLRRIARVTPRSLVRPRSLRLLRTLTGLQTLGRTSDVEVLPLGPGASVRVQRPDAVSGQTAALLWIHGGGYVLGRAAQDDGLCRRFRRELGITVGSVDYRLAPEHPYPAALEDCYAALLRLADLPGVDATRIAIGGASAGGGLAAALALLARDRGEVAPVLQLLSYPMLDDRSAALPANRDYRLWTAASNGFGWAAYLGGADPAVAVPARRDDLSGVAPAWLGVGTLDLFYEEDLAYARRLQEAGVPCELETVDGAFHGFDLLVPKTGVSQSYFASQCASLRRAFTPKG